MRSVLLPVPTRSALRTPDVEGVDGTFGSPAGRLMAILSHSEVRRQLSITSPMDLVKTAFSIALDEDFPD